MPDALDGHMAAAARHIAYRAVRNRGTIGGSIAHADPAADWPTVLLAAGAEVIVQGPVGAARRRRCGLRHRPVRDHAGTRTSCWWACACTRHGAALRWGYRKLSVKVGEFAHAFAVAMDDPTSGERRAVVGAIERVPLVLEGPIRPRSRTPTQARGRAGRAICRSSRAVQRDAARARCLSRATARPG